MKRFATGLLIAAFALVASAATLTPIQLLNPAGSTSGQAIVSTGASTAPAWSNVTASGLTPVASNTVIANATASSASPTALSVPSCSGTNNALLWATNTGFTCGTGYALTTGNLSQFASTTSAQLAGVLSDETGTGAVVFGTNPTISGATVSGGTINNTPVGATTASTGRFTTLQATSTITPSSTAGIVGTTTNDNANAGAVGEVICAQVTNGGSPTGCATNSNAPVSLSSNIPANVTSVSLTAGDWNCWGNVAFTNGGTTVTTQSTGSINTTSATMNTLQFANSSPPNTAGLNVAFAVPMVRQLLASTTMVYLVANNVFATSTSAAYGRIDCRRAR